MKDTIRTILHSWIDRKLPSVIPRETSLERYLGMRPRKIMVVTGFRRVGKTYLLFQLLNTLLEGRNREQAIYVNFDDERVPQRTEFLTKLLPAIRETFSKEPELIFLDEIQNMPNWGKWLRRTYDNEDLEIFVTGSTSMVSSREMPSELRGRCLEVEVFPLSFGEFLGFKDAKVDTEDARHSDSEKAKVVRLMDEYLEYGGMPEVVLTAEDKKLEMIHQYYATVVGRDIIEKFRVRNEEGLRALMRLLLNSTQYSISRTYDTLKSLNYEIGKTTILNYLSYMESSYFVRSVPIFSPKVKDQLQYARKVYFIDNGFINALSTKFSRNSGRLCENAVAIELIRRGSKKGTELYYWRDRGGKEVDFVVKEGLKVERLVQVCHDIEDRDTRKRETGALLKAARELRCANLSVITGDYEGTERIKGRRIDFIPIWKWLLAR